MARTLRDAIIALIVERSVNWLAPTALPYAWAAILAWLTVDVLRWAGVQSRVALVFSNQSQKKIMVVYLIAFVIGGSLLCLYLYGSKKLFAFAVARGAIKTEDVQKGSPTPASLGATPTITRENVELYLARWLNSFQGRSGSVEKISDQNDYFSYRLVFHDGFVVGVSHRKEDDRFITLHATLGISQSFKIMYDNLNASQTERFFRDLVIETNRLNINCQIMSGPSSEMVVIEKQVPIDASLTDLTFFSALHDVHREVSFTYNVTRKLLTELSQEAKPTQPSPTPDKATSPPLTGLQRRNELDKWIESSKALCDRLVEVERGWQDEAINDAPKWFNDFERFVEINFSDSISDYDRLMYFRTFLTPEAHELAQRARQYKNAVRYCLGQLSILRDKIK